MVDDLVLNVIADFCSLRDAKKIFGEDSRYIKNRSASVIARVIRNFAGMVCATRDTFNDPEFDDGSRAIWTRAYFCLYPKQFSKRWHKTVGPWKKSVMAQYIPPQDFERDYTRLELFRLQRRMDFDDVLAIGW